jgi:hypothetical protein
MDFHGYELAYIRSREDSSKILAFKLPYVYDYIIKLYRQQAEVIQNHNNENVRNTGQGEAQHKKYKKLKLGGGQAGCHRYSKLSLPIRALLVHP